MKLATVVLVILLGVVSAASAAPPTAANFSVSPSTPQVGQQVSFGASATGGQDFAWDFDNDGAFDDAHGEDVTREFATSGPKTVRMLASNTDGDAAPVTKTFTVSPAPNAAPVASFRHFPASPRAGEAIDFVSLSHDPDGPLSAQEWDLDNDGQFDDAAGSAVARSYPAGGRSVRLRVRDSRGASAVTSRTFVVAAPLVTAGAPLNPFPVVRMVGRLTRNGTRVLRFTVAAPEGVSVIVRCNGPRCPRRRYTRLVTARRLVRLRPFERRLRPGVVLQVFVFRSGSIGKYTRFGVRKGTAPSRRDRCLAVGARIPSPCPGS